MYTNYFIFSDKKQAILFFISGILGFVSTAILFIPVFVTSNYTFSFLTYSIGDWNLFGYIARFIYKNIALYGLVPFLFIAYLFVKFIKKKHINIHVYFAFLLIFVHEILFLKVPLEISYLLPLIFVVYPMLSYVTKKNYLMLLLIIVLLNNFITLDFLNIKYNNERTEAISSEIGIFFKNSIIKQDLIKRDEAYKKYKENILSE